MPTIRITRRFSGATLFECEVPEATPVSERTRYVVQQALLTGANLTGANLTGADLGGADLGGANLGGANLGGAYLGGADLTRAYLGGADLTGADLTGADLTRANLTRADLTGADLGGATWAPGVTLTRAPLQFLGLRWPVTVLDTHMQIGCQLHPLAEWTAFDDATIAAMDGKDALRFWRAHKGWLLAAAAADGRGVTAPETAQ